MVQEFTLNNEYYNAIAQIEVKEGPIAIGGEISVTSLLNAYSLGLFPWSTEDEPIMWYSPDPRMVLHPVEAIFSKSLLKSIRNNEFQVKFDTDFESVISNCAMVERGGETGTWITNAVKNTFIELHKLGLAHSIEAYKENIMVGGLYGLSLGRIFFGESMFHLLPNASKTAFYFLVDFLKSNNFDLIDAQQETPYLASFGAKAIPRAGFMEILKDSIQKPSLIGQWGEISVEKRVVKFV